MEARTDEILNIEYHTKILVLKALNSSNHKTEAAAKLGKSVRHLFNLIREYDIHQVHGSYQVGIIAPTKEKTGVQNGKV